MESKWSGSIGIAILSLISVHGYAFDPIYDGRLPVFPGEPLSAEGQAPREARSFWEKNGPGFKIYWDHLLNTPRYVSPRASLLVAGQIGDYMLSGDLHRYLEDCARRFVDENREFFGVAAAELAGPAVQQVNGEWLLSFRQVFGDVAVRGASLRLLIHASGALESAKAFLLRDRPAVSSNFADVEPVLSALSTGEGSEFDSWEKELIFTAYDPASFRTIWAARGRNRDREPIELFIDPETGAVLDRRIFAFELGELGIIDGDFLAAYPDPDPKNPNYNFMIPENADPDAYFPVVGAYIYDRYGGNYTDPMGSFAVPAGERGNSVSWELTTGGCEKEAELTDANDRKLAFCPRENGMVPTTFRLSIETSPLGIPVRLLDPGFDPIGKFIQFRTNGGADFSAVDSARFLAFHHVREFMSESDQRMNRLVASLHGSDYFHVVVPRVNEDNTYRAYLPDDEYPRMYLAHAYGMRVDGKDLDQLLTPTIIKHEYAHHIIFRMTGALRSVNLDCFRLRLAGETKEERCSERVKDLEMRFEVSLIEGLADALAAYDAGSPLFGYYDHEGKTSGLFAYDISRRDERMGDVKRNAVAKLFWEIYQNFVNDQNFDLDPAIETAKKLLYHFIAKNNVAHGTDRTFDLSPLLVEELLESDDAKDFIGGDGDPTNGTPHQRHILAAFNGLDLVRAPFIRGDANQDGAVDLSDAIYTLGYLFLGNPDLHCRDAMDANDTETLDISDPIHVLTFLFFASAPIPAPYPGCGIDPTEEALFQRPGALRMSCHAFSVCPP